MKRCSYCNLSNELYINYHDYEWGVPKHDDRYLFELLVLESFQAGLSWEMILNKRENFRIALDNFDYEKIANYNNDKINELLNNKKIIRNKLKIMAIINNAKIFIKIREKYQTFNNYIWSYTNNQSIKGNGMLTHNELSDKISKDLYNMGMRFVGSITIYSYLQAIGIIIDHEVDCFKY